MFALEVIFKNSAEPPASMFIRRPQALIGGSSFANIVIDDLKKLPYQIRLIRSVGRSFRLLLSANDSNSEGVSSGVADNWPSWIEGTFQSQKQIDLGTVKISITALDSDLLYREGEALDKLGFRVLRLACAKPSPLFPAVAFGSPEVVVSFNSDLPLIVGRSRDCPLRIESPDVSSRHARIGFESGAFWVEDLGSTNGTFVGAERVTGRRKLQSDQSILIAKQVLLKPLSSEQRAARTSVDSEIKDLQLDKSNLYPKLISLSEVVKPKLISLESGKSLKIGRDPSSDIWIGAPHVSRVHMQFKLLQDGTVAISDLSTNGTESDAGVIPRDKPMEVKGIPRVFNFGTGLTLALVFSLEQEKQFKKAKGSLASFGGIATSSIEAAGFEPMGQIKISDVGQLVGKRGRKATAHQLKSVYKSSSRSTRLIIWVFLALFLFLIGILLLLLGQASL
jgi:pSer/pThr/pTyr-binding forkhead associated (FHA) protein